MQLSKPVKIVLAGWSAFAGTHLAMSHPPIREKLIELSGSEFNYRLGYSAVAATTASLAALAYFRIPSAMRGPVINTWMKSSRVRVASGALRSIGTILAVDAFVNPIPNPMGMLGLKSDDPTDLRKLQRKYQVYGLQRLTRHSEFLGYSMIALGQALVSKRLAPMVFWGIFPIFSVAGALHQEYRHRKTKPAHYFEETSFLPFGAMLSGHQSFTRMLVEIPPSAYAAGFCIAGLIFLWP